MQFWPAFKRLVIENQMSVVLLAFILGILLPDVFRPLNNFSTQFLILVFFFSSLRLSLTEVVSYAKDWRMLAVTSIFMLVVLPFALFIPALPFGQDWAVALLILGAMPTGMTIALVAEFFGGKTSLALVVTTVTSLLAPFSIPLVTKIALGEAVPIPVLQMFWSLFLTIVAPFMLAMLMKRAAPKFVERRDTLFRNISVVAFGLLIAGIIANTSSGDPISITLRDILILCGATVWLGVLTWAAYFITPWRARSERVTVALCMLYMNNTLALFVADKFFSPLGAVPKQILLLIVVNALLPPLKLFAAWILRKDKKLAHLNPFAI